MPAVASRASPAVESRARPSGWATTVVGPLSSTIAPVEAARPRAAARRSSPGRVAGEAGELAVVGREDRGAGPSGEGGGGIVAEGGQAVAVDEDRHAGRGHHLQHGGVGGSAAPEAGSEDERAGPIELIEHDGVPPGRRGGDAHGLGGQARVVVEAGRGDAHHARARPLGGAGRQVGGAGHARRPGGHDDRGPPLVGVGRAGRHPRRHVGPLDQADPGPGDVEPDVGQHDLAGEGPAAVEQQPRLEGGERDRADRLDRARGHRPGQPVDPARDVHGENRGAGGVGRAVLAVEAGAERRVDHQVAGRQALGGLGHRDHDRADAAPLQQAGGRAAVVAVVALAGDHDHPPPVGAAQQVERLAGHGRRGPPDQDLDGLGRLGVDRAHLLGGQDRLHSPPRLTAPPTPV